MSAGFKGSLKQTTKLIPYRHPNTERLKQTKPVPVEELTNGYRAQDGQLVIKPQNKQAVEKAPWRLWLTQRKRSLMRVTRVLAQLGGQVNPAKGAGAGGPTTASSNQLVPEPGRGGSLHNY